MKRSSRELDVDRSWTGSIPAPCGGKTACGLIPCCDRRVAAPAGAAFSADCQGGSSVDVAARSAIAGKMAHKGYSDELDRAVARPDVEQLCRHLDVYAEYHRQGSGHWSDETDAAFGDIFACSDDDPEKSLAYVVLGAARSDDSGFLAALGCGTLENILRSPSPELLGRIVAEARKSARFRWLLSCPFRIAIAPSAWDAIVRFRITGPHVEPAANLLPPRPSGATPGW